ncbi:MAG TPA: hypothetical protein PK637_14845 [Flavobacteriales bacterium]|nr:hypothetical protein [Flavobacteriales bacterium]HRE98046.1 hypothetical protein [Flavobacteriales bacterium]HRJ35447.1 hypothetical protein [Flavobacteriales bacterium]HRJ40075.1 hypothetical protein [Flavobacteriales bacterium]
MIRNGFHIISTAQGGTGTFSKWSDGLLLYELEAGNDVHTTISDLEKDVSAAKSVQNGERSIFLSDIRQLRHLSRDKQQFISKQMPGFSTAAAALVASPLSRIVMNGFILLFRPDIPTRLFDDPEKAIEWLKKQAT